jgi:hypothetical protein
MKKIQVLWIIVILSAIADLYTTYLGLKRGYIEGNPLANRALQDGFISLVIIKSLITGIIYTSNRLLVFNDLKYVAPTATSIIWFGASVYNLFVIGIL